MNALDLILYTALLGGSLVARLEAQARPPAELLQNLDLLDDMPLLESGSEAP